MTGLLETADRTKPNATYDNMPGRPNSSEIDFSKYRRHELAEHLSTIASIPGTVRTILTTGGASLLTVWVVVPVLFLGQVHWSLLIAVSFYATLSAVLLGCLLGVVLVINNRLGNLVQVIDMTLEISEHVSDDVADLRDGTRKMPTARQIIYGVYDSVVLPTLEGVVRGQSKLIGGALFGLYRWALGRLMAKTLREAPLEDVPVDSPAPDDVPDPATLDAIDGAAKTTGRRIAAIRDSLTTAGTRLRRIVIIPLTSVVIGASLVAALPLIGVWLFAGG